MKSSVWLICLPFFVLTTVVGCGEKNNKPGGKACRPENDPYGNYKPYPDFDEKAEHYAKIDLKNSEQFVPGVYKLSSAEIFYHNKNDKGSLKDLKVHVKQSYDGKKETYNNSMVCVGNFQIGSQFAGGEDVISFMDVKDPANTTLRTTSVAFERNERLKLPEVVESEEVIQTPDEFFAATYPAYDYTFTRTGVNAESGETTYEWRANVQDGPVDYELRAIYTHVTHEKWAEQQAAKEAKKLEAEKKK